MLTVLVLMISCNMGGAEPFRFPFETDLGRALTLAKKTDRAAILIFPTDPKSYDPNEPIEPSAQRFLPQSLQSLIFSHPEVEPLQSDFVVAMQPAYFSRRDIVMMRIHATLFAESRILFVDSEGLPFGVLDDLDPDIGPHQFLRMARNLKARFDESVRLRRQAAKLTGVRRASRLDAALRLLDLNLKESKRFDNVLPVYYNDVINDILANDPDDELGLREIYEERQRDHRYRCLDREVENEISRERARDRANLIVFLENKIKTCDDPYKRCSFALARYRHLVQLKRNENPYKELERLYFLAVSDSQKDRVCIDLIRRLGFDGRFDEVLDVIHAWNLDRPIRPDHGLRRKIDVANMLLVFRQGPSNVALFGEQFCLDLLQNPELDFEWSSNVVFYLAIIRSQESKPDAAQLFAFAARVRTAPRCMLEHAESLFHQKRWLDAAQFLLTTDRLLWTRPFQGLDPELAEREADLRRRSLLLRAAIATRQ